MPCHPDRVRPTGGLPEGYQFGDAREPSGVDVDAVRSWRRPSETAAEQLTRRSAADDGVTANVIEGDHH